MSDNGSNLSRRSSSQTSHTSGDSKRRTLRGTTKRSGSKASTSASHKHDPSLTSFPSFSPEQDGPKAQGEEQKPPNPKRTTSQKARDRKTTLAGLTNASPSLTRQNALFDDSPRTSLDVPGSLHLASDEHIERQIARTGAVKLIRQYAQDLAQRDAEISLLRVRADNRERELKRLLREADVSSADIERRLLRLELDDDSGDQSKDQRLATSLDGMMSEAMSGEVAVSPTDNLNEIGLPSLAREPFPALQPSVLSKDRAGSFGTGRPKSSTLSSRNESRANSIVSESSQDLDATLRARVPSTNSGKVSGLQNVFQPPVQSSSYFIGGAKILKKPKAGDEISVRSNQSSRSFASWTQIFGGKTSASKPRSTSVERDAEAQTRPSEAESALAKLSKTRTSPPSASPKNSSAALAVNIRSRPLVKRTPTATRLSSSPKHGRKGSNASLPLTVELDNVLEPNSLPPTMTPNNIETNGLLTDRFGFIYDQRRRTRQSLQGQKHKRNRLSGAETIASYRSSESSIGRDHLERAPTPMSMDEDGPRKSWQDYLKPASNISAGRPRELLFHTPSAGAVVTVSTADAAGTITPPRTRATSVSVSAASQQVLPTTMSLTDTQPSIVTATSADFAHEEESDVQSDSPTKLLLEQLNEIHDSLQAERMVKWNDFLRRVRAERASSTDKASKNAPEAELVDGELIGIATLGRSAKQKAKYAHFKSLVLGGIPVTLRPKIWGECSGATARRIPGYYEDLVARSEEGSDIDQDTATQIKADVRRTLTDNVYFSQGPGIKRLEEVLRAYSIHQPTIGYCQGMNLITASLLLICATSEDCFWLLVAVIDTILPSGYFSGSLLVARADQLVLRQYVDSLLPTLGAKLDDLGVELEACTFHWFLSLYAGVLTGGEALFRVWDVLLVLNSSEAPNAFDQSRLGVDLSSLGLSNPSTPITPTSTSLDTEFDRRGVAEDEEDHHPGTSSPFLFQLALALLKLNESAILALDSPAQFYIYLSQRMTDHAIAIDQLIQASEALRTRIRRNDVLDKRKAAIKVLGGGGGG